MARKGAFTFVLHSHIPYTRQAGRWPHGEEWIHEAIAETYIPLLDTLYDLHAEGIPARLTLTLTPVLLEQLADEDVQANFIAYVDEKINAASQDIERFEKANDDEMLVLAKMYRDWYSVARSSFLQRYERDLIRAFRNLQNQRLVEIATCAATHGYLPLLGRDESINLQLHTAVESYKRHFGRLPRTIWLPECAYRPGYIAPDGRERSGIERFLEKYNIQLFFAETHMIEGGQPVGVAAGDAIGPYQSVTRRYLVPKSQYEDSEPTTTFLPYLVYDSNVAVIGRNNRTGLQVWSGEWGYPGDYDYREFHKKDGNSGMQYWRVTGTNVDLADKSVYQPQIAAKKVMQHAEHFTRLVEEVLGEFQQASGQYGIVSSNYDTELFGHWWFEGVDWLRQVLHKMTESESVELTTASAYLNAHPAKTSLALPEGSWGAGGTHFVWDNADTEWMWPIIHEAETRMMAAVEVNPKARLVKRKILDQAARELLLLQSSDWPFLVTTGQANEYAIQRFREHVEHFNSLLDSVTTESPDEELADRLWERDKIFPDIDYRWFRL
jgi:1,4-alpha-glucan branching enzyme